jgi:hypothetical protein
MAQEKRGGRGPGITYHMWNCEVGVGGFRHAQGIVAHPRFPFWQPFPEAMRSGVSAIRGKAESLGGHHTILGRSLSSFACQCSYSVGMLRAERKKSVGCEVSKSDERDTASIAKRCVLCKSTIKHINIHIMHLPVLPRRGMNVGRRTGTSPSPPYY